MLGVQVTARLLPLSTPALHFYTTFRCTLNLQYRYGRALSLRYLQYASQPQSS